MRVSTEDRRVSADPGTTVEIHVDVVNTSTIIDGLTARLIGLNGATVRAEPALLPIFPDAEGRIALSVDVPDTQQAGAHPLTVEVVSHTTGNVEHADVDLDVAPRPALALRSTPRMVRARRSGRFVLEVANEGNVPLEAALVAPPGERGVSVRLSPATLRVEPGTTSPVIAVVRGPRMITGAEIDRSVQIELTARRLEPGRPDDVEPLPELTAGATLQLKQRPVLSRGLLTAAILAGIVGLWALVFLLGLTQVFAGDPVTKSAPASFFPAAAATGDIQNRAAQTPADALPKTGLVPSGVGGEIGGVVTAKSDGNAVGRILVEAYRTGRDGKPQAVSSAATQSDGSYTLAGLFPTSYKLKFSAEGIEPVWFPSAKAPAGAEGVMALAQGAAEGIDATVTGRPGSLSGTVDPGDSTTPVRTQVVARLLNSAGDPELAARTMTDAAGGYRLPNLVAPGTYELSFTAPGYQVAKVVQQIAGGEDRLQPSVLLSAGGGRIAGVLTDGSVPLGGVSVTTTVGGEPVSVTTPTTGTVGAFSLEDLPTPGTYVVTFSAEGYGARTVIIDLEAGESRLGFDQALTAGTGSIAGIVRGPGGKGLGGVEVTVGGASTVDGSAPRTTTITTGSDVGSFTINDLAAPGTYTLTFSLDGFSSETRPVTLSERGSTVDFTMSTRLGGVTGAVRGPSGSPLLGATVTATNGTLVVSAVSSGPGGALPSGGYLIPDLPPGWYSVTVTADGMRQMTALVRVLPGNPVTQELRVTGAS